MTSLLIKMDVIRCSVKAGLNFRGTKLSRMAVEPRNPRKFSTAKIKVHTVYRTSIVRFRPRVQNGQDGRPLRSRRVRLKYSPRITSNKKEIVRNEADTPTSPSGKDTGICRRNHAN